MDTHGAPAKGAVTSDRWPRPVLAAVDSVVDEDDVAHAEPDTNGPERPRVSFDDFYRQEYRRVLGLAYVLTGSVSVAEDTTQDAFTDAYRQWGAIGGYDSPAAWVRRVTCNRAASVVRRRLREAKALVRLAYRTPTHIELDEGDANFWRSVRTLPPRQAQAVALFYLEDYSVRDIASVLDCSEGTVKTHLSRARTAVARQLRLEDDHE
ncbi:MAG TPA: sigma-70 family RNA polymerase sigma factor [Propionibacteriaceae bacterium]